MVATAASTGTPENRRKPRNRRRRKSFGSFFKVCIGKTTSPVDDDDDPLTKINGSIRKSIRRRKTVPVAGDSGSVPNSREIHVVELVDDHLLVQNEEKGTNLNEPNNVQVPIKQMEKNPNSIQETPADRSKVSLPISLPRPPRKKKKEAVVAACGGQSGDSVAVGEFDSVVGALIIFITLMVMLIWGKMCAVLCTAIWFYLIPILRSYMDKSSEMSIKNNSNSIDFDSAEYKKKIVLQGFLERN